MTILNPTIVVRIEYDGPNGRVVKECKDQYAARRFWTAKFTAGKNPKIVK